ncbi:YihY/virulence factor BrkB family protein [Persicimonas caeni]|jgi:YihY family inner membrane protein|uniref:YihY/virulence factor BrkB family protein n=1 Tax=Persicimonas caeni TaxID=2292766 RepID=A0A4Y6PQS9_PERCE|nr:YihY/virulence factor BrkB family protein [Persicimonas caeni]QDG50367.1 YihY/virulence factor BrkB family protein [Persicimonas caeni]QED31588.1 YihY/virulence factor BrkB family protein [Persicimonas caeni]
MLKTLAGRLLHFAWRVIKAFLSNQGILLAGGLAYNSLLSAIPLVAVVVMSLSYFIEEQQLLETISAELVLLIPSHADTLTQTVRTLLENRSLISGLGIVVLLFFSSIAFRMLEEAIANIFHVPDHVEGRSFWMSALIPYAYIVVIGLAIVGVTGVTAFFETFTDASFMILGWELSLANLPGIILYVSGFVGMAALFTSVYAVLPVIQIQIKRAVIGGVIAAILWEVVRRILVWYFASISLVNVIYGSLATVIVVLLGLEIGAIILLLGAQVIAELEHSAENGVPWYVDPEDKGESATS